MKAKITAFLFIVAVVFGGLRLEIGDAGPLGKKAVRETASKIPYDQVADSVDALYRRNSYPTVNTAVEYDITSARDTVVRVNVTAGFPCIVDEYRIIGYPFNLPVLETTIGKHFTDAKLALDMKKLVGLLENEGLPFGAVVVDSLSIGAAESGYFPVRIVLSVFPGETVFLRQVVIPENLKTKAYVVERLMLFDPPERFSQARITKGIERIRATGWLNVSAEPQLLLDETGFWLLRVPISENRSVAMNGILGYTPGAGGKGKLTGHFDAAFYNIAGTGRELKLLWDQVATEKMEIGASYVEPWILGGNGDAELTGNYYSRDSTYTRREIGLKYSLPLDFNLRFINGASFRAVDPDSIGQNVYRIPASREYSIESGMEWSGLRPKINPRKGIYAKLTLQGSYIDRSGPDFLFEDFDKNEPMLRLKSDFKTAFEVLHEQVLFIGIHNRSAFSKKQLPLSDRYYLGGWGSLRGYREEQFSAEHILWANIEWRLLLGSEAHGYAFFDSGVLKRPKENEDFRFSYGVGLRLNSAIGRWDVSYGVGTEDAITGGYLHVGLSTGFE
jgi:outer membrane protein assembly factor BamA